MRIAEVPIEERASLEHLLAESFHGWYLSHSKKTLLEIEVVREAVVDEHPAGLVMLKTLYDSIGYVYYVAVARDYRRRKVATRLLEHSLEYFSGLGAREVYASIGEGNVESEGLFRSRGFVRTRYREVSSKYGHLRALSLYRKMLVVPGEILLCRPLVLTSPSHS
ncbi:MAG: GNAT family N-acetyltransferase [Nitrososphaerales archaeon]